VKYRWFLYTVFFVFLFAVGFFIAKHPENKNRLSTIKRTRLALGTVVEIQVRNSDKKNADSAIDAAFKEIDRIEELFSPTKSGSITWKINHSSNNDLKVDKEIFGLLLKCDKFWKMTGGALDVSLGSLIEVWDFDEAHPDIPLKSDLDDALNRAGWKNLELKEENTIHRREGLILNFGAVAKGYAVDKAVEILKKFGINDLLVNAGGEIRELGNEWIIGIQHPRKRNEFIEKLNINHRAVATSGDYEQYFEKNGERFHHILDPTSGYPSKSCQSVTVIADDALTADALATGVFVLGWEKGLKLIDNMPNIQTLIIDSSGKIRQSSNFYQYIQG